MGIPTLKILVLDLELAPNIATVWSLWKQTINPQNVLETSYLLCFSSKWIGVKGVEFYSLQNDGKEKMLKEAHRLMSEADAIIGYNSKSFDIPLLNREFLKAGMKPPSPVAHIDLLKTVRREFRFVSNKLDHVCQQLGIGSKTKHEGYGLWLKVMDNDPVAWAKMERYNRQDVKLTEALYYVLQPWIRNHPNYKLYDPSVSECPNCGGKKLQKRGYAYTRVGKFQRYQCKCGAWSRGSKRVANTDTQEIG